MRVLATVLTHAGQIAANVARAWLHLVERRRQQQYQAVIFAYEPLAYRCHCLPRPLRIAGAGDHRPRLRDRIDLALGVLLRPKRRSIVEIRTAIPVAVPRALDRLGERSCRL